MKKASRISPVAAWIAIQEEKKVMVINLRQILRGEATKHQTRAEGCVVPDSTRCVQCGICSYACPIGIDVRRYAWKGRSISEGYCLTCGECVARCPRGVLRFERSSLFEPLPTLKREV
ncbi:MAG: 4Fe-4S dicluster domain-containing protein [Anaerolineales bacterium]